MGGGQARSIGLSHTDAFRWIGTFSGTIPGRGVFTLDTAETMFGSLFEDPSATNAEIKLWWMAVGEDETAMLAQHRTLTDVLRNHRIAHTFVTIPGGHTWHVWRRNLRDFLPLLFQK
jgi:enterochelin esterase family protein